MKKNYWQFILMAFFALGVSFVVIKYKNKQQAAYTFLPRKANVNNAEWEGVPHQTFSVMLAPG